MRSHICCDQQIAFNGPYKLYTRLGNKLDVHEIANYDPDEFATPATTPPAIHRYGGGMAKRVQTLCQHIVTEWDGDSTVIWTRDKPTGADVLERLKALPGYGEQKARILLALLGKQLAVIPKGWREAAGDYGLSESRRSVANVVNKDTLAEVRAYKKSRRLPRRRTARRAGIDSSK
ncbi:HhH-GPD-type base excision DNA repair protein [Actinokineospora sp. NBRC 105648]|uniref:HhH-GPD-type base excision DNA repair protein n=1 Tax=Actinokineospora sp. NBRC 105648 TaxID=3032206 RepID=UPI0025548CE0|nr:HhH-GPD-type base excision DNA repair protein [Actinokineospora sp. NBRC 105648]